MNESDRPARTSRVRLALLGALVTLSGPFLWAATIGVPVLWQTGLLMWLAFVVGAGLGVAALWRDRRVRTLIPAGVSIGLLIVAVPGYAYFTALPQAPALPEATKVAAFTLPNQDGTPVALGDLLSDRAVLLVFYRGYW